MSKKFFQGIILESVFLNMINDASDRGLHGYAIFRAIQKKFGVNLAASTLYPELKHLEEEGLIIASWELIFGKARKQYRITKKGKFQLKEYCAELRAIIPNVAICT
jgi:DNA-binding PadR family transcriptional regulator